MQFIYGEIELTERELRVARCRAEAAGRGRELARKFAASAKKSVKENLTRLEDGSRVARCRAEAAARERELARKVAAKKRVKKVLTVVEANLDEDHHDAPPVVRHLRIPTSFTDDLMEPGEFIVLMEEYHSVVILRDPKNGKLLIKGCKENAVTCYRTIKKLIAEWRRRKAVDE